MTGSCAAGALEETPLSVARRCVRARKDRGEVVGHAQVIGWTTAWSHGAWKVPVGAVVVIKVAQVAESLRSLKGYSCSDTHVGRVVVVKVKGGHGLGIEMRWNVIRGVRSGALGHRHWFWCHPIPQLGHVPFDLVMRGMIRHRGGMSLGLWKWCLGLEESSSEQLITSWPKVSPVAVRQGRADVK
jgi:hypothetical protein